MRETKGNAKSTSKLHYCDDLLYLFLFNKGVEKKNDDLRRYFHRKIKRWDATKNLLLVEKRQEEPRDAERTIILKGGRGCQDSTPNFHYDTTERPTQQPVEQQPLVEAVLKKKTVGELLVLLEERTGCSLNRRTREKRRDHCPDALLEDRVRCR